MLQKKVVCMFPWRQESLLTSLFTVFPINTSHCAIHKLTLKNTLDSQLQQVNIHCNLSYQRQTNYILYS